MHECSEVVITRSFPVLPILLILDEHSFSSLPPPVSQDAQITFALSPFLVTRLKDFFFFFITMSPYFQHCQILITLTAARNHLSVKCEHEPIDAVICSGEDVLNSMTSERSM